MGERNPVRILVRRGTRPSIPKTSIDYEIVEVLDPMHDRNASLEEEEEGLAGRGVTRHRKKRPPYKPPPIVVMAMTDFLKAAPDLTAFEADQTIVLNATESDLTNLSALASLQQDRPDIKIKVRVA